jgi:host factor-I protein
MKKENTLQESFLERLFKEKVPVFIYMIKGIKLQGYIEYFATDAVWLNNGAGNLMVYKHIIATICPSENIFFAAACKEALITT